MQYFRQFVTDEMLCSAVEQSNLYSVQKDGEDINLTKGELGTISWYLLQNGSSANVTHNCLLGASNTLPTNSRHYVQEQIPSNHDKVTLQ